MNPIKSFLTSVALVPLYVLSAWLTVAGVWKTVEICNWASNKAEQTKEQVQQLQSIIQFLPEVK